MFDAWVGSAPGDWSFIGDRESLTEEAIASIDPSMIFLLHWSWKVPRAIIDQYECVGFHMTDLPYGRGGSPLQNLIARGHRETRICAIRLDHGMDTGPVYLRRPLGLDGSAESIYKRATELSLQMAVEIVRERPEPRPQVGEPVVFRRRRPAQSEILDCDSAEKVFDLIRMLDAAEYPKAFLEHAGFRFEFSDACWDDGEVTARVRIRRSMKRDAVQRQPAAVEEAT